MNTAWQSNCRGDWPRLSPVFRTFAEDFMSLVVRIGRSIEIKFFIQLRMGTEKWAAGYVSSCGETAAKPCRKVKR